MNAAVQNNTKACIFCGTPLSSVNRAKEHVIAQTLLDKFDILQVEFAHSHLQSSLGGWDGLQVTPPALARKFIYNKFLCGRVCGKCNHGWMSNLDNQVAPILLRLAKSNQRIGHLPEEERSVLANWATKTAMVLSDTVQPGFGAIPRRHASTFHQGGVFPDLFAVLAAKLSDAAEGFRFSFCSTWLVEAQSSAFGELSFGHAGAYKVFMQIKNIMFLVCFYPVYHATFLLAKRDATLLASTWPKMRYSPASPSTFTEIMRFAMAASIRLPSEKEALYPPAAATCYCGSGKLFGACCERLQRR